MNTLSITFKDLQIMLKNRGNIFLLFLMPLIFIFIFSGALSSVGTDEPEDQRIPLAVVNLDVGQAAQTFLTKLDSAGGVRVELYDQAQAQSLLEEKKVLRVLTIPVNFTASLAENQPVALHLVNHNNAPLSGTNAVQMVIDGVVQDMVLEQQILLSLKQMGEMQSSSPIEYQQAFGVDRLQSQARTQFMTSQTSPLVSVIQRLPRQGTEQEELPSAVDTAVPASIILFVFLTAQSMAVSIYQEKKIGSFRRLLAAPISKAALLAGKMLPSFLTCVIQMVILFAFGTFGMQLMGLKSISLGNDILALVLVCLLMALCCSTLGIVIASLAKTEGQITGLSTLLLWGMGMVSFVPGYLLVNVIGPFANAIPQYWAKSALEDLLLRGLNLADITTPLAALAGFTILFFAIGLWRFDFD